MSTSKITGLSVLDVRTKQIVLDASAMINLASSGYVCEILEALPHEIIVPDTVLDETIVNPATNSPLNAEIQTLVSAGLLKIGNIDTIHISDFLDLTGALKPDDLGDGEAATIIISKGLDAIAAIDDTKALRVLKSKYPSQQSVRSIDLFLDSAVEQKLTRPLVAEAIYNALMFGRMHIPFEYGESVRGLIGSERFTKCPSIRKSMKTLLPND